MVVSFSEYIKGIIQYVALGVFLSLSKVHLKFNHVGSFVLVAEYSSVVWDVLLFVYLLACGGTSGLFPARCFGRSSPLTWPDELGPSRPSKPKGKIT